MYEMFGGIYGIQGYDKIFYLVLLEFLKIIKIYIIDVIEKKIIITVKIRFLKYSKSSCTL